MIYFCVLDFEATCWDDNSIPRHKMEIIEFPSILYKLSNNNLEHISKFHYYVKPVVYPKLSNFCINLTGIKQNTIDNAESFSSVYKKHIEWLKTYITEQDELYFVTCGDWDFNKIFPNELKNKKLIKDPIYKYYINIKKEFEYFYKKKISGMIQMLSSLQLPMIGKHHSGIDDTTNIAQILVKIVNDGHLDFFMNEIYCVK